MKTKIILIIVLLLSLSSCNTNKMLVIGDNYVLSLIDNCSSSFMFNKLTSQKLYYLLDKNASSLIDSSNINDELKKSKKVILSIGIFDIFPCFDFSNEEITINNNQINNKLELLDYYIYHSFSLIDERISKKTTVYVLEQINPLINDFTNINVFEEYIYKVNTILLSYCNDYGFIFVNLDECESYLIDDFVLTTNYKDILNDKF